MNPYPNEFGMTQGTEESAMCHHQLHQGCEMPVIDDDVGKFDQAAYDAFMRSLGN
ncbi:hypothetical protein [Burkholderia cenocepacia]|uniref:hypothetical protein n=1 Tax=Burkholderia cenocepacia TaxID=95486 RepID=UPI0020190ECD|nr:hypothetical protein [Burkholderia cenocepacia]MCO1396402.1 hypothetical protein [Burkholderia cenocepacia]MCO1408976.1 hypothetical protein [Burkholderia cenocepacia]UQN92049.1 hypothetical protein L0Z06_15115 [Burkholderia cenocepacia]UQN99198.1 hypothetical protein L0Z39_16905 [Burkholderia cenocepacia]UQP50847.1 hypothetical protein L0Y99_10340 [Burkholderia cenocepacia]